MILTQILAGCEFCKNCADWFQHYQVNNEILYKYDINNGVMYKSIREYFCQQNYQEVDGSKVVDYEQKKVKGRGTSNIVLIFDNLKISQINTLMLSYLF